MTGKTVTDYEKTRSWWWIVLRGLFIVVLIVVVFGPYLSRLAAGSEPIIDLVAADSALVWLIAAGALVFGLLQVGIGFRLKSWQGRWTRPLRPLLLQPVRVSAWQTDRD